LVVVGDRHTSTASVTVANLRRLMSSPAQSCTIVSLYSNSSTILIQNYKKASSYSITERRVTELIPVLGSQPAGNVSHKPSGRLPLLSVRPAVTPQPLRGLLPVSLVGEHRHDGCEQFAYGCYPTASRLRFEPRPFCA